MPPRGAAPSIACPGAGRPIALAIVALVIGAVFASTVVLFAVTFSGPPPFPFPMRLEEVAARLKGERPPPMPRMPARFGLFPQDATRAAVSRAATLPPRNPAAPRLPAIERRLAMMLGTTPDRIVIWSDRQFPFLQRDIGGAFVVGWRVPGGWRIVQPAPRPLLTSWHKATLAAMLVAIVALALPAWFIARAITRPLRRLAVAAQAARAGARRPAFPDGGPAEVRALTEAVAAMHDRLTGYAEARTAMLAAIAHDLGTPLSRLSFLIEQLPDAAHDRATRDIDEMRGMIRDTLAFARDESTAHESLPVDLPSLLDALVEDMNVASVDIVPGARAIVRGDPGALRRMFQNLVGNALRYGERATIGWVVEAAQVMITVEDNGPGIDPLEADRLFEPFVRGESSRNRATGGTGLGLAIVRSIVTRHGGSVRLDNRPSGGAVAIVMLPIMR